MAALSPVIGPIDLVRAQRFGYAVSHRQAAGIGRNDGNSRNHGSNLRVRSQQAAEAHAEHLGVVVERRHCQLYLHVFGGVQSIGIFQMSVCIVLVRRNKATTSS